MFDVVRPIKKVDNNMRDNQIFSYRHYGGHTFRAIAMGFNLSASRVRSIFANQERIQRKNKLKELQTLNANAPRGGE